MRLNKIGISLLFSVPVIIIKVYDILFYVIELVIATLASETSVFGPTTDVYSGKKATFLIVLEVEVALLVFPNLNVLFTEVDLVIDTIMVENLLL